MSARLINCSIPSKNLDESINFYETLLGVKLARSMSEWKSYYAWASAGVKLTVNDSSWESNGPLLTFAVDDLGKVTEDVTSSGGRVLKMSVDLSVPEPVLETYSARFEEVAVGSRDTVESHFGTMNIIADPSGTTIALMQLSSHARAFFTNGIVPSRDAELHELELTFAETALREAGLTV